MTAALWCSEVTAELSLSGGCRVAAESSGAYYIGALGDERCDGGVSADHSSSEDANGEHRRVGTGIFGAASQKDLD